MHRLPLSWTGDPMPYEVILAFLGVALLAYVTPGPDWFVVMRYTNSGKLSGFFSALGVQSGLAVHMTAAVLGVTAILLASSTAFTVLKLAGAVYLIFLGIQSLRRAFTKKKRSESQDMPNPQMDLSGFGIYWRSLLANVLNPKAALFFAAILPQFANPDQSLVPQVLLLGALDIALGFIWWFGFVFVIAQARRLLGSDRSRKVIDGISGGALIALGAALVFMRSPNTAH